MAWSKRLYLIVAAVCLVAALAASGFTVIPVLVIENARGETARAVPVPEGGRFTLAFRHSVAKSAVEEDFLVVSPGAFKLIETRYKDFGAGLPHMEQRGLKMEFADGRIRLSGYDRKFEALPVRVGWESEQEVRAGNMATRLDSLERPGNAVTLRIEPWRRASWWLWRAGLRRGL